MEGPKQDKTHVPWQTACRPVAGMKMAAPICWELAGEPGSVPGCMWFTSLDPPYCASSSYYSCFLFYRHGNWDPKRQRQDLNWNQFCELWSTILNSLAMSCWCGPTGSKVEWGSASWVLVLELPSSWESGSFTWPCEPACLTLSSADKTTCPIYLPGYGKVYHQELSAEEHRKLWNTLSTQVGEECS